MGIRSIYNTIILRCLDIVAPPFCASCKQFLKQRTVFCIECEQHIQPVISTILQLTPTKSMKVFAVSDYKPPLRNLVLSKSGGHIAASAQLGELIWEKTVISHQVIDYLIPVPLHWSRFAWRGYNQADEIAKVLAQKSGKPCARIIKRITCRPFQSHVAQSDREANVKGAFQLCGDTHQYHNKHLVIVDDVITTGATLKEIGKQLLPLKPASLSAVVACRVI